MFVQEKFISGYFEKKIDTTGSLLYSKVLFCKISVFILLQLTFMILRFQEDLGDLELIGNDADTVVVKQEPGVGVAGLTREANLQKLIGFQAKFLETVRETKTVNILGAIAQLGHMDTTLAESIWLDMFPRLWGILSERQQSVSSHLTSILCKEFDF